MHGQCLHRQEALTRASRLGCASYHPRPRWSSYGSEITHCNRPAPKQLTLPLPVLYLSENWFWTLLYRAFSPARGKSCSASPARTSASGLRLCACQQRTKPVRPSFYRPHFPSTDEISLQSGLPIATGFEGWCPTLNFVHSHSAERQSGLCSRRSRCSKSESNVICANS